jgi:hypothetical protein
MLHQEHTAQQEFQAEPFKHTFLSYRTLVPQLLETVPVRRFGECLLTPIITLIPVVEDEVSETSDTN